MNYLMGIDLGSTSLKAVVYDLEGNVVSTGSRPTERFHPEPAHPEWTVWKPEQIWGDTARAIRDAVSLLDDPRQIRGVAVTGMGMDGLPVDENGKWLYPFISWHDPRTLPQLEWWKKTIGVEKVFSLCGNPLWAINSALRILWVAEHEPEIMKRTDKWLLIEDFLNFMLCGRKVTDYSMASCTLLFDQRRRDWSHEMLELSGIDRRLMPEVLPSTTPIGEISGTVSRETGLPAGTPVILGGHDHLCGTLPVGAFRPGVVLDVTGTWESVITSTPEPILTPPVREAGLTVQSHVARDTYATWGATPAAEALEWFRKHYGHEARMRAEKEGGSDWDHLMADGKASPPGARGVMFLPHLSAAGCPVQDDRSLGAFLGLSTLAGSGDMLRAVIEGLDYQFLDIVRAMEGGLGRTLDRFVVVGGAVRNEFWMQNKADVVGRPAEVPDVEEATPLGAAILAGIGLGLYRDENEAYQRVFRPGRTFEPNPERASRYAEWFEIYRELYPALRPINHRLFDGPKSRGGQ